MDEEGELRKRKSQEHKNDTDNEELFTPISNKGFSGEESDSDGVFTTENDKKLNDIVKKLPQGSDNMGHIVDSILSYFPERWRNWIVRGIFTIIMIYGFKFVILRGPLYLIILYDLPWFRTLSWYFLLCSNYFFFGESMIEVFKIIIQKDQFLRFLVDYHRFISFCLYCIGFVWFVLSLRKGYYLRQFSLFAWTHVALMLIVVQSFFIIENILQGVIWFLVPVSMIICCDVMSYMFGFFFGKTPLIKLSPKKTWEGFIGGAISTVIFGLIFSYFLMKSHYMVCPYEGYVNDPDNCTVPSSFLPKEANVPKPFSIIFKIFKANPVIYYYPFLFHSLILSLFASIIGPFGGFFASGFKRAFKIKDFGDIIPGHGGLMDRFDCQLLIGTFVHVYIFTFIKTANVVKIIEEIEKLSLEDKMKIYTFIKDSIPS
ncbi:Phosphatidate cytidylyltransferase [Strongyloides ratti]|uniref:Phosphatidate cytidylyltransferase n=1 Tax=Strongyloides ratti TaxID=34506 RepID=A0A090KTL1_STRRB|nr:Phosphatidate cytidylyltransferase [Strongyloides ratti]CEF60721.1 Phosphatidate cytidylyltransferase [Strongyloides ratti]